MKTKPTLACFIFLALGFAAGWLSRSAVFGPPAHAPIDAGNRDVPPKTPAPSPDRKPAVSEAARAPDRPDDSRRSVIDSLNALAWAKKKGAQISVSVFERDRLDPKFASVYNLSADDVAILNRAIADAKGRMDAIAMQMASFKASVDGSKLTVEVPSTVERGGPIYDGLLQTFRSVLGPDRFQSFGDVSGDSFEYGFNYFGLSNVRYEVYPSGQNNADGAPFYTVVKSSTGPERRETVTQTIMLSQIGGLYPVLGHFIPAGYGAPPNSR